MQINSRYVCRDVLKKHDYVKIRSQRLQGLVLNAFCLRKHLTQLRLIEVQYTKTGFGGMWVREQCSDRNLCFYLQCYFVLGKQGCCEHKDERLWSQRLCRKHAFNSP